jgi:Acetyltransferase (GNAT) domain
MGTMERAPYKIISYRPEYHDQIVALHQYLWGGDAALRTAYIDWKYVRNPYLRELHIYLAMDSERVIGIRSFVGAKWQFGSPRQTLVLPLEADTIITPEHRNQGLVSLMMETAMKDLSENGYRYVLSLGTIPRLLMSDLKRGWRSIGSLGALQLKGAVSGRKSLPHVRALLRKSRLAVALYRKLRKPPRASPRGRFDLLDRICDQKNGKLGRHISIAKSPRIAAMVQLRQEVVRDSRIRHVQDEEYYTWRLQNPASDYRYLFWDDSKLQGYLVLQATRFFPAHPVALVDWCASSDEIHAELMRAAIQSTYPGDLFTWSATLSEGERGNLESAGFRLLPEGSTNNPWIAAACSVLEMPDHEWCLADQRLLDIKNCDFRLLDPRSF